MFSQSCSRRHFFFPSESFSVTSFLEKKLFIYTILSSFFFLFLPLTTPTRMTYHRLFPARDAQPQNPPVPPPSRHEPDISPAKFFPSPSFHRTRKFTHATKFFQRWRLRRPFFFLACSVFSSFLKGRGSASLRADPSPPPLCCSAGRLPSFEILFCNKIVAIVFSHPFAPPSLPGQDRLSFSCKKRLAPFGRDRLRFLIAEPQITFPFFFLPFFFLPGCRYPPVPPR